MKLRVSKSVLGGAALTTVVLMSPVAANDLFNLQSLVPGMALGQSIAFVFLINGRKLTLRVSSGILAMFFATALLLLASAIHGGISVFPSAIFLALVIILAINGFLVASLILENPSTSRQVVVLTYYAFLTIGFHKLLFEKTDFLLIGEPSYFALIVGPLSLIAYSFKRRLGLINLLILFGFAVLVPNITIALFGLIQAGWLLLMARQKLIFFCLFLVLALIISWYGIRFNNEYIGSRVTVDASEGNLSSLLYIVSWIDVWNRIQSFDFLGTGVGSAAIHLGDENKFSRQALADYGSWLTYNSGTFWFARAMQTIGFVSLAVIFVIAFRVLSVLKSVKKTGWVEPKAHLVLVLYSTLLPELFFRAPALLGYSSIIFFVGLSLDWKVRRNKANAKRHELVNPYVSK